MSKLLEERKKSIEAKNTLLENIEKIRKERTKLSYKLELLRKKEQELYEQKGSQLSPEESNSKILFCIKCIFSGPMFTASEYWDYYYYDFVNDAIVSERVFEGCHSQVKEENIFDLRNALETHDLIPTFDSNSYLEEALNHVVNELIIKYSPNTWEELNKIIKKEIKNSNFFQELANYKDNAPLTKKL